jgi:hypothetical protein
MLMGWLQFCVFGQTVAVCVSPIVGPEVGRHGIESPAMGARSGFGPAYPHRVETIVGVDGHVLQV